MSARVTDDPHNTPTGPDQGDDVAGTSIDGADLTIVLNRYDIGSIQHVSEFQKGSRRAPKMMIRTQGGEYLLKRLAPGRDGLDRVEFSHGVQRQLQSHRFPIAGLVETVDGETMVHHKGHIFELFHFMRGKRFDKSNQAAAEAGRVLAHMHDLLAEHPLTGAPYSGSFHDPDRIPGAITDLAAILADHEPVDGLVGIEDTLDSLRCAFEESAQRVEDAGFRTMRLTVIHGDWHPGNLLYEEHAVVAVIDFDSLRIEPRVSDVANGALQFSVRRGDPDHVDQWPESCRGRTIRAMIQSYDSFCFKPLSEAERAIVPDLMIEAMIVESVIPIHHAGTFGSVAGSTFLRMVDRKVRWLAARHDRIIEVIAPAEPREDSFG